MPWLLNEDEAIKEKLRGFSVPTYGGTTVGSRNVEVWFGHPADELQQMRIPGIIITLTDIRRATDREHRGRNLELPYTPEGMDPVVPAGSARRVKDWPIPYDLDYAITTYTRDARQDRILTTLLFSRAFPDRYGFLYIPQDGTTRRLDRIGYIKSDTVDENQKRMFRTSHMLRVSTELLYQEVRNYLLSNRIRITLTEEDTKIVESFEHSSALPEETA